MSVTEQMYTAVLAMISEGLTVSSRWLSPG